MSYSLGFQFTKDKDELPEIVLHQNQPDGVAEALSDAQSSVIEAVYAMMGGIGSNGDSMTISITGHANPNHAKVNGWADEFMQIRIGVTHKG